MRFIVSILFVFLISEFSMGGTMLKPGQKAPDFSLKDALGTVHKLSDYASKIVVLYFYPKDDTPGCTAEACNIRDNYAKLRERDIIILGISFDDQESHQKFSKKYDLPFPILSDTDKKVTELYGAKRGALLSFMGPKRITYLIGADQIVLHLFDKVNTKNHTAQIIEVLEALN